MFEDVKTGGSRPRSTSRRHASVSTACRAAAPRRVETGPTAVASPGSLHGRVTRWRAGVDDEVHDVEQPPAERVARGRGQRECDARDADCPDAPLARPPRDLDRGSIPARRRVDHDEIARVETLPLQGSRHVAVAPLAFGGRRDRPNSREESGDADRRDAREATGPVDDLVRQDAGVARAEHPDDAVVFDRVRRPDPGGGDRFGGARREGVQVCRDRVEVGLHRISGPARGSGRAPPREARVRRAG